MTRFREFRWPTAACLLLTIASVSTGDEAIENRLVADYARIQKQIQGVEYEATLVIRIGQGAMTNSARRRFKSKVTSEIPPQDETIELTKHSLRDFQSGLWAGEGTSHHLVIELSPQDVPVLELFSEWSKSAFNGTETCSLTPRDQVHKRSIPNGIKFPVEFQRYEVSDGGDSTTLADWMYPVYFWAGGFPDPNREAPGNLLRRPVNFAEWKFSPPENYRGAVAIRAQSPPNKYGGYDEVVLRPDFDHRIVAWTRYSNDRPQGITEITYDERLHPPTLVSWELTALDEAGKLVSQYNLRMRSFAVNPKFTSDQFTLAPTSGMIVNTVDENGQTFSVAGQSLQAETNYKLNAQISTRQDFYLKGVYIAALVSVVLVSTLEVLVWRRRRSGNAGLKN